MTDEWNELAMQALIGSEESLRFEFKAGSLFEKQEEQLGYDLSKVVSAFANTEGGLLILGMAEGKSGKNRVAARLDGVSGADWSSHRLQQLLESNIHPPLTGIRVRRVPLSGFPDERVAFVVEVPQGRTAHQAKDFRYYGRSEFEAKPLRDFDIRLRMERGKLASAEVVSFIRLQRSAADILREQIDDYRKDLGEIGKAIKDTGIDPQSNAPEAEFFRKEGGRGLPLVDSKTLPPRYRYDEYEVTFELRNVGGRTIREFEVQIDVAATSGCGVASSSSVQPRGGFFGSDDIARYLQAHLRSTERDPPKSIQPRLLPGNAVAVGTVFVLVPEGAPHQGDVEARWTVFLDDVLPREGRQDLAVEILRHKLPASPPAEDVVV
jgi:Schlafen, AlbA_2